MEEDDPLLTMARITGRARASTDRSPNPEVLAALAERRSWDVLVVPLKSGDRDRGYLEVRDRLSRWGRFRDEDLQLLETLSGHVATALDNLRLMESLRHEAYHDAITGLRNRLGLHVEGQAAITQGWGGAILLVELDVLSQVNNALGHDRGERLLRMAGERLVALVGESRPVARIEADRFAVLVSAMSEAELTALGNEILATVGRAYSLDGIEVDPQAVVGIAFVPGGTVDVGGDNSLDPSTLLQRAEMAMLAAKSKSEQLQIYRPSMGEVYRRRFQLVTQFRQAVEQGRIIVHYQPKVDLAQRELVGVEALVRWMHPEFGLVSPAEFVEAIEATGSIDILLGHVLDIVLQQLREWTAQGIYITAAVNLSVRNLLAENFPAKVADALAQHGVPAELLTFEITESSVMTDPEHSLPVLRRAARDGCAPVGGRLRHRLLLAGLPPPAADRRDQDRPVVRPGHGHRPLRPGDRPGHRRPGALARPLGGRRGGRGGGRKGRAAGDEVRSGAGLPDRPADAAGSLRGLAAGQDGQHLRPGLHHARAADDELTAQSPGGRDRSFSCIRRAGVELPRLSAGGFGRIRSCTAGGGCPFSSVGRASPW